MTTVTTTPPTTTTTIATPSPPPTTKATMKTKENCVVLVRQKINLEQKKLSRRQSYKINFVV